ncbi:hypothetical protein HG530_000305 [Fusarium avenaceum]|nr:hypothetical protein HG530_000305 [Fusarium avenaceum]
MFSNTRPHNPYLAIRWLLALVTPYEHFHDRPRSILCSLVLVVYATDQRPYYLGVPTFPHLSLLGVVILSIPTTEAQASGESAFGLICHRGSGPFQRERIKKRCIIVESRHKFDFCILHIRLPYPPSRRLQRPPRIPRQHLFLKHRSFSKTTLHKSLHHLCKLKQLFWRRALHVRVISNCPLDALLFDKLPDTAVRYSYQLCNGASQTGWLPSSAHRDEVIPAVFYAKNQDIFDPGASFVQGTNVGDGRYLKFQQNGSCVSRIKCDCSTQRGIGLCVCRYKCRLQPFRNSIVSIFCCRLRHERKGRRDTPSISNRQVTGLLLKGENFAKINNLILIPFTAFHDHRDAWSTLVFGSV